MREILSCILGGAAAGAAVGWLEALTVASGAGSASEYWVFPYAAIGYGLCGVVIAPGAWVVLWLGNWRDNYLGRAAALTLLVLGVAVGRYHIVQRVLYEQADTWSLTGLAVQLGLLATMGAAAWVSVKLGALVDRSRRGLPMSAAALTVMIAATAVAAAIANPTNPNAGSGKPSTAARGSESPSRPNLILIVTDTLRADALGSYGAGPKATPALDDFATRSVRFVNAHSNSTWTRPSVATILTSLYPSQHRAQHKADALPDEVTTLAETLAEEGYFTAAIVNNINLAPIFNFQQGFNQYTYLPPDFYFGATDSAARLAIYKGLRVVRERLWRDRIYFHNYYQDAAVVNRAVAQWLDRSPPAPFFLFIHYMDPHDPFFEIPYNGRGIARVSNPNPPAASRDAMRRLYAQDVGYLDTHLGELFQSLAKRQLFENSVIALLADHGEELYEHGGWWHGTTLYDEQTHVPLLIKRAREQSPGHADGRLVTTVDVAPSLVAALGIAVPEAFVGRDLFSPDEVGKDAEAFAEEDFEGNVLSSIRHDGWKLIAANPGNPRGLAAHELYDLSLDRGEKDNRAAHERARLHDMLRRLAGVRAALARDG